ncbi:hypothetical protein HMPREF1487_09184 [Pseudomonas sp. HPB0071]|uniref:Uncharacterized protein n=1 Tax=Pseudomonas luteola TaxID=47886 RepID=A0A2X2DZT9_PSELU|nr:MULTISPECIES: hypothetical protein [Pseudomonas]ENA27528.1 hypothetical protein HMPREF1487_09184 [Pseudomonas sp. HPB0071]SHJ41881.1 hypothetical protein SAMN05216295_11356 [Pseudomonas zeshuii]SPZ00120.1 Uncharacterised protein [Pseudomonas luteola]SPZ00327.1 Uncharacterised protein [Pseudomonas luteola]
MSFQRTKRIARYFWIVRKRLLLGSLFTVPLPLLAYLWLGGRLALENAPPYLAAWSKPGFLALPTMLSILWFIVGACILLFTLSLGDIDDVLETPQKGTE